MNKEFIITPSIYCADTSNFKKEIKKLIKIGIQWIHFDVMDGQFVENYALGPKQLNDIKRHCPNLIIDVHIMAVNILNKIALFSNADYITFHWKSIKNKIEVLNLINEIKKYNIKVGIAIDINEQIEEIKDFLTKIDLITLMAIKPGFTGQSFDPDVWHNIKKIPTLKQQNPNLLFQIDGGIRWNNFYKIITSNIDLIVVGSILFSEKNYFSFLKKLKNII
ncbi:ribulose-phosphate 3-epimerase [Spiroplasma endosymbiont of Stenodema calcarata]|uniref:ribulose-phosphate 3-epimerase n=1 Tax=Spiroplasma endosymbiont of Stenodema calcarata TaxID=3139328 RepID=UPI003CCA9E4F